MFVDYIIRISIPTKLCLSLKKACWRCKPVSSYINKKPPGAKCCSFKGAATKPNRFNCPPPTLPPAVDLSTVANNFSRYCS